ncbi:Gluconate transport-inducing protein [Coemansia sp. Benny D115]|nr:Gluconate transport-inducing protein [Coemansia sp. Benny D115]
MEDLYKPTYTGYVGTSEDAILLFEACQQGLLHYRSQRMIERERKDIKSGSVYVWSETDTGIKRWTDGRKWSPSRADGSFLTYQELESKSSPSEKADEIPVPDGLIKRALSILTSFDTEDKLHLMCYYRKKDLDSGQLMTPTSDPALKSIKYDESKYSPIIPELVHTTVPLRQSHTVRGRRPSVVLPNTPAAVNLHGSMSLQQTRPQSFYTGGSRKNSHVDVAISSSHGYSGSLVRQPYHHADSVAPPPSYPSFASAPVLPYQSTSDSRNNLRQNRIHNINQGLFEPSTQLNVPAENTQLRRSSISIAAMANPINRSDSGHELKMLPPQSHSALVAKKSSLQATPGGLPVGSNVRCHSHPYVHQGNINSDNGVVLPPIAASATAPSSRRNTIFSRSDQDHRLSNADDAIQSQPVQLPPISEVFKALEKSALSTAKHINNSHYGSVENARSTYTHDPWTRRYNMNLGGASSMSSYSIN